MATGGTVLPVVMMTETDPQADMADNVIVGGTPVAIADPPDDMATGGTVLLSCYDNCN